VREVRGGANENGQSSSSIQMSLCMVNYPDFQNNNIHRPYVFATWRQINSQTNICITIIPSATIRFIESGKINSKIPNSDPLRHQYLWQRELCRNQMEVKSRVKKRNYLNLFQNLLTLKILQ